MTVKTYLLSVPERLVRSVLGLGAGVAREVGEVALPDGIRRSQLYQNLVDATLRYLIEQVGGVVFVVFFFGLRVYLPGAKGLGGLERPLIDQCAYFVGLFAAPPPAGDQGSRNRRISRCPTGSGGLGIRGSGSLAARLAPCTV